MSAGPTINQLDHIDQELETILTSFDTNYVWNYGSVKEGLRDLYEKAKREQWNSTTELEWGTSVDPETGILPDALNPLNGYAPFEKLNKKERAHMRHAQVALQLSQFLHGEQGALIVASQLVGGGLRLGSDLTRRVAQAVGQPPASDQESDRSGDGGDTRIFDEATDSHGFPPDTKSDHLSAG